MTYISASDLHHCGRGNSIFNMPPDSLFPRGAGSAVCLTHCVDLFVAFKALSPHRQTVRAKSTDKQCIFPRYGKHFTILLFHRRRTVDATQSESVFKGLHLSMFGFRSSWSNMRNVLATNSLHYYRLHNVIPLFFFL